MGSAPPSPLNVSLLSEDDESGSSRPLLAPRAPPPPSVVERARRALFGLRPLFHARTIGLRGGDRAELQEEYVANVIRNQKYSLVTFVPVVLYEQFRFFFNLYFLFIALTQFVKPLQVGYMFTYVAPLAFVLAVTMVKEAYDDIQRWKRDRELNGEMYERVGRGGIVERIPSCDIRVGDFMLLHANDRVPADMLLLRTEGGGGGGGTFIRTDQLDGETDWKLRRAVGSSQAKASVADVVAMQASVKVEAPRKAIYDFEGAFTVVGGGGTEPLSLENTLWMNTVVATGTVLGLVVYTGKETRSTMNVTQSPTKVGILDWELNRFSKILFAMLLLLSFLMIAIKGFTGIWFVYFTRFFILFSSIIPISMKVNLDVGKIVYSFFIMRDAEIEGTIVRTSTIPEELGRIQFLLTDKTGTLTQNEMVFKRLHVGTQLYTSDMTAEVQRHLLASHVAETRGGKATPAAARIRNSLETLALCHNVSPVTDDDGSFSYQAASPDEVALVKYADLTGLKLEARDMSSLSLRTPNDDLHVYDILAIFPFTSASKRMGIVVRRRDTGQIAFHVKGADVVMLQMVNATDWLEEECGNMAREGLRTLVCARRLLSADEFAEWEVRYNDAKISVGNRAERVAAVVAELERNLDVVCLTGVEDKLQEDVQGTLETLRNAGIQVWMLTGDKVETATCIAISSRLVSRGQQIFQLTVGPNELQQARQLLDRFAQRVDTCLVIDGTSLTLLLDHCEEDFITIAGKAPSVVCCRCSPTQKAQIVHLIGKYTGSRTCAIGDGGNDVSMIQAACVGVGIVGKEGRQASLAADFSINQFSYLARLALWHGRNSYKRSARLSQFVIHRGLIITVIQAIFSAMFYFAALTIYDGWLLVGYATLYTAAPVFSLVLDQDVEEDLVFLYPELYKDLQKGRALSAKTFSLWTFRSVYQGGVCILVVLLFGDSGVVYNHIVAITFTSLLLSLYANCALEVNTWHRLMILAQVLTILSYVVSMFMLPSVFPIDFVFSTPFLAITAIITFLSMAPVAVAKLVKRRCFPPIYRKLDA